MDDFEIFFERVLTLTDGLFVCLFICILTNAFRTENERWVYDGGIRYILPF